MSPSRIVYSLEGRVLVRNGEPLLILARAPLTGDQSSRYALDPGEADALARRIVGLLNYGAA